jgi:ERCC4-related helicase
MDDEVKLHIIEITISGDVPEMKEKLDEILAETLEKISKLGNIQTNGIRYQVFPDVTELNNQQN